MKIEGAFSRFLSLGVSALGLGAALVLGPSLALADSISPSSFSTTLGVGESVTITKTVTVNAGAPTSALVDIMFVADTTGSMFGQIASAKAGAASILSALSGLGDVQFGVASYKDFGDVYTSRIEQNLTATTSAVTTAINTWGASGGGDFPEANLVSWKQVAESTTWRAGSRRFIVTFGDAPGHNGIGAYPTEAVAIAALNAAGVQMEIINTGTATTGMNSAVDGQPAGQANRFATATGGHVYNSFDSSGTAAAITAAITTAFATYSNVSLQAVGNAPGVGVAITPGSYVGAFDRSIDRTFTFDVTFTGLTGGTHSFVINALVDGGIVATESDRIVVGGGGAVPEPSTLLLLGAGALGLGVARRRQER